MIDVEGAEWAVLKGAERALRARNVLVWVSVHEPTLRAWYRRALDDLVSLMADSHYVAEQLPSHGETEAFWFFERQYPTFASQR